MRYLQYTLIALSIFLSGCLSEQEIKARQENAFDLSGTYKTTEDSEVQLNFTINNQNAAHDILVHVDRTTPLLNKEKDFLSELTEEHGTPVALLTNHVFPTTFGGDTGLFNEIIDGGDNISDDFGQTSRFHICSGNSPEHESKKVEKGKKNIRFEIYYCLSGTVKKETKNIIENGRLSLQASYRYDLTGEDGGTGVSSHEKEIELQYRAEKVNSAN